MRIHVRKYINSQKVSFHLTHAYHTTILTPETSAKPQKGSFFTSRYISLQYLQHITELASRQTDRLHPNYTLDQPTSNTYVTPKLKTIMAGTP